MTEPLKPCAKCGKDMIDSDGTNTSGVHMILHSDPDDFGSTDDYKKKQMGKYSLDKEYSFCWECCLDALFQGGKNA